VSQLALRCLLVAMEGLIGLRFPFVGVLRNEYQACHEFVRRERKRERSVARSRFAFAILPVHGLATYKVAQLSIWLRDSGLTFVSFVAILASPCESLRTSRQRSVAGQRQMVFRA
jgi:hypothetical protein